MIMSPNLLRNAGLSILIAGSFTLVTYCQQATIQEMRANPTYAQRVLAQTHKVCQEGDHLSCVAKDTLEMYKRK